MKKINKDDSPSKVIIVHHPPVPDPSKGNTQTETKGEEKGDTPTESAEEASQTLPEEKK